MSRVKQGKQGKTINIDKRKQTLLNVRFPTPAEIELTEKKLESWNAWHDYSKWFGACWKEKLERLDEIIEGYKKRVEGLKEEDFDNYLDYLNALDKLEDKEIAIILKQIDNYPKALNTLANFTKVGLTDSNPSQFDLTQNVTFQRTIWDFMRALDHIPEAKEALKAVFEKHKLQAEEEKK